MANGAEPLLTAPPGPRPPPERQGGAGDLLGKAQVVAMQAIFPAKALVIGIGSMAPAGCEHLTGDYGWDAPSLTAFLSWLGGRGVERRRPEHLARALAIAAGHNRRVHPKKTVLVKVAVNGVGHAMSHARHRGKGVGAHP